MIDSLAAYAAVLGFAAALAALGAWEQRRLTAREARVGRGQGSGEDDDAWVWQKKVEADPHLRSAVREVEEWLRR